jgi:hypothetical protein
VNADQLSVDKTYAHNDQEFDQIIRFLDEKGAIVVQQARPGNVSSSSIC